MTLIPSGYPLYAPETPCFAKEEGGVEKLAQDLKIIVEAQCLFPPYRFDGSTKTFWAQEYVGADLVRKTLEELKNIPDIYNLVEIWDSNQKNQHAEKVSQLIAGPYPSAPIPSSKPIRHLDVRVKGEYARLYGKLHSRCQKSRHCPSYINNSMEWGNSQITKGIVSDMNQTHQTTVVTAAGNQNLPLGSVKAALAQEEKLIVVASLKPSGMPSSFTNYSEFMTIAAPSDHSIRSYDYEGKSKTFGGTSGATPLVTSALASFSLITDYPLKTKEAVRLLKSTEIPLPLHQYTNLGMLNAYKISAVASKIQKRCDRGRKRLKDHCIRQSLKFDETYNFEKESSTLFDEAIKSFPECAGKKSQNITNSCEQKKAWIKMRKATLLTPSDKKAWKALACIKKNHFGKERAEFYTLMAKERENSRSDALDCRDGNVQEFMGFLDQKSFLDILDQFKKGKCGDISESALTTLLERTLESPFESSNLQSILVDIVYHHPQKNLNDRLSLIVQKSDQNVKENQEFILQVIRDPRVDRKILYGAMENVIKNGDQFSDPKTLLQSILSHPKAHQNILSAALHTTIKNADKISSPEILIQTFLNDPRADWQILLQAVHTIDLNVKKISQEKAQKLLDVMAAHHLSDQSSDWIRKEIEVKIKSTREKIKNLPSP
ncbi:MAG: S8/S53 family peptidase [Bacteriovoracales bacterium]|nr:S8/S53 family peptidase [Bacteriovoracales bacterium]